MRVLVALCVFIFHVSSAKTVPSCSGITGGVEAKPNALPWVVESLIWGQPYCGGTIICPRFVITAAHCVKRNPPKPPIQPQDLEIVAGVHDWSKEELTQSTHKVKALHVHPEFIDVPPEDGTYDNALIELADPIDLRPEHSRESARLFCDVTALLRNCIF